MLYLSVVHSFSLLNNIPLDGYAAICFSIRLYVDMLQVSGHMFSLEYKVELPGCMISEKLPKRLHFTFQPAV